MRRYRAAALAATVMFLLGWWLRTPCHNPGWPYRPDLIFGQRCYSDLPVLYTARGLGAGYFPYASPEGFEYPVLTGLVAGGAAAVTRWLAGADPLGPNGQRLYVILNGLFLLACLLLTVWAVVRNRGRGRDGLLVALAPSVALTSLINWDLFAVALTALALLAWERKRPGLAGVLIGLGAAAKLYPALILGPMLLLALRDKDFRAAARTLGGAALAWLVVNLPIMLPFPVGWARFWELNAGRGADFGSVWYALKLLDRPVEPLNPVAIGLLVIACLGIAALAYRAPAPPTLPALGFLVVAAFLITNKVYSPQYVLWLLPLAVLAGLSIVELAIWQVAEALYWLAIWQYLDSGYTVAYPLSIFLRVAVTVGLMVIVARRQWMWSLRQVAPSEENPMNPSATMSKAR